ncbi:unnamed protein product [Owenia fusiformis]|uniref:Uncharacterized protein n=1 Tax=Owenia fusiformis TaxID=6347 RepID=A0A8J1U1B7_OWEFU|nr:unnamed protein product [Owenia fusiformis]
MDCAFIIKDDTEAHTDIARIIDQELSRGHLRLEMRYKTIDQLILLLLHLVSCQTGDVTVVDIQNWTGTFSVYFVLSPNISYDGWKVYFRFSTSINFFTAFDSARECSSADKTVLILKNVSYNKDGGSCKKEDTVTSSSCGFQATYSAPEEPSIEVGLVDTLDALTCSYTSTSTHNLVSTVQPTTDHTTNTQSTTSSPTTTQSTTSSPTTTQSTIVTSLLTTTQITTNDQSIITQTTNKEQSTSQTTYNIPTNTNDSTTTTQTTNDTPTTSHITNHQLDTTQAIDGLVTTLKTAAIQNVTITSNISTPSLTISANTTWMLLTMYRKDKNPEVMYFATDPMSLIIGTSGILILMGIIGFVVFLDLATSWRYKDFRRRNKIKPKRKKKSKKKKKERNITPIMEDNLALDNI